MRRAEGFMLRAGSLLLALLPIVSRAQTGSCYATVYNDFPTTGVDCSGYVTVNGVNYHVCTQHGSAQIPLTGPATMYLWNCVWNGTAYDCGYISTQICPGGVYDIVQSGTWANQVIVHQVEGLCGTTHFHFDPPGASITVTFHDDTPGSTAWSWDFGDGTPQSPDQNPTHTFPLQLCPGAGFTVSHWAGIGSACVGPTTQPLSLQPRCIEPWKQGGASRWAGDPYDNYPGKTMAGEGCAATVAAIMLDWMGKTLPDGTPIDPGSLNNYLENGLQGDPAKSDGYYGHKVHWDGTEFQEIIGRHAVWPFLGDTPDGRAAIDAALAAGDLVPLEIPHGTGSHFVLVTGKVTEDGTPTYSILDPGYPCATLADCYNNHFTHAVTFKPPQLSPLQSQAIAAGALWVDVLGVTSLDVIDGAGRHSLPGSWAQIPGVVTLSDPSLSDDSGPDSLSSGPDHMTSRIPTPSDGHYSVNLNGVGGTAAAVTVFGYDSTGVLNLVLREDVMLASDGTGEAAWTYSTSPAVTGVSSEQHKPGLSLRLGTNPLRRGEQLRMQFSLPAAGHATLRVVDVAGTLVATLSEGPLTAGPHEVIWNGATDRGAMAPPGVYFVSLAFGGTRRSLPVVVLR